MTPRPSQAPDPSPTPSDRSLSTRSSFKRTLRPSNASKRRRPSAVDRRLSLGLPPHTGEQRR
eukprot:3723555-Alexandrium_andersonii.AAC.1